MLAPGGSQPPAGGLPCLAPALQAGGSDSLGRTGLTRGADEKVRDDTRVPRAALAFLRLPVIS